MSNTSPTSNIFLLGMNFKFEVTEHYFILCRGYICFKYYFDDDVLEVNLSSITMIRLYGEIEEHGKIINEFFDKLEMLLSR